MKLLENWKTVLRKAWSIKFNLLAGVLGVIELGIYFFIDSIPKGMFLIASVLAVFGGIFARLLSQDEKL